MISYSAKQLRGIPLLRAREWLLADGNGGFASSTTCFMNTRRQHSLLTVSTSSPLKRFTLLNKLDEEVVVDGKPFLLATNLYPEATFPEGYKFISRFEFDYFPQVTFDIEGTLITKRIIMPKGSNSIFIHYRNLSKKAVTIRLLPLISFRWKDSIRKSGDGFLVDELPDGVRIISDMNLPRLYLKLSQIYSTSPESHWYYDFVYPRDKERYEEDREDLYNIGFWETEIEPEKGLTFAASTRDLGEFDYEDIESRFVESIEKIRASSGLPKRFVHLADSAANHLARTHSIRSQAIIDSYPYGTISIKDSLISINGVSYASEKPHYESEYLYDLLTNEVGGTLPSAMRESDLHVNYDDPSIPLYLALEVIRCAEKADSKDCIKRYLPFLDDAAETILQSNLGGSRIKGTNAIDTTMGQPGTLERTVSNAATNALLFNLLKLVDGAKSDAEAIVPYSEVTAEIESDFFGLFYESDGRIKGLSDSDWLTAEMALPLVVPYSPLNEQQREMVFKQLYARFIGSLETPASHTDISHDCNLLGVYLAEGGSLLPNCQEQTKRLKEFITDLAALHGYTTTVNALSTCGLNEVESSGGNISSAVVTGETIRVIKRLKLK